MSNSEKHPEAWKVYIDCVRKWPVEEGKQFPTGWKYGIPNPENTNEYLFSDCPGKLFNKFKNLYYINHGIRKFRIFLWKLENLEGKISESEYKNNVRFLQEH